MIGLTGVRYKFKEKAGMQLSRVICKTDPWAGKDCEREDCPMCETSMEVEGAKGQDCSKRNVLYETWCQDCKDRDEKKAIEDGRDPDNVPLYKYLGESARSSFEQGIEHLNDRRLMNTGSHMLKHLMENHREENHDRIKFRMRVLKYHRSSYERQIHESVAIQNARKHHHILNSRAEYNRCALPRLTLQMGERDYKKQREEELEEMEKEKALNKEIEAMKRTANKRKDNNNSKEEWKSCEEPVTKKRKKEEVNRSQASVLENQKVNISDIRKLFEKLTARKEHPVDSGGKNRVRENVMGRM